VVLISIDSLRADHVGAYGYERDTTPFLDALAARGVLFEHAISPCPRSLPAHMSMLTGLYPPEHGVVDPGLRPSPAVPLLAEHLQAAGYTTAAFTGGGAVSADFGFARGFQRFDGRGTVETSDVRRVVDEGIDFVAGLDPDERFFLMLHTYAAHAPHDPPGEYGARFWEGARPPLAVHSADSVRIGGAEGRRVTRQEIAWREAMYDAEIRFVDDALAHFFTQLEAIGVTDVTVIVTAGHGEEFGEHGMFGHGQLYHETLHVPLLVVHPGLRGGHRVTSLVELVDVSPTVLELAGLRPDTPTMSGISLLPLLVGPDDPSGTTAVAMADPKSLMGDGHLGEPGSAAPRTWSHAVYAYEGDRLYHAMRLIPARGGGEAGGRRPLTTLFELASDPAESVDLGAQERRRAQDLLDRLDLSTVGPVHAPEPCSATAAVGQQLDALGYLGSGRL